MRFRFRRSTLVEELATTATVSSQAELRQLINDKGGYLDKLTPYDHIKFVAQPSFSATMRDQGHWETHLVTINGEAIGFSDGTLPFEMPVERRKAPVNRLPENFDTSAYQAMLVTDPSNPLGPKLSIKVSDLSHADTAQLLCMAMTVITRLEEETNASSRLIDEWHDGTVQPDKPIHTQLRELMSQGINKIDNLGSINHSGYMSQAREKMLSAIACLVASEKQPKENQ